MSELVTLKNIGKELERKLKSVDINSAEELKALGSEEAFVRLKFKYSNISLVHLYALEGAVTNTEFNQLNVAVKKRLKQLSDSFATSHSKVDF